jgi:hypothetical protein
MRIMKAVPLLVACLTLSWPLVAAQDSGAWSATFEADRPGAPAAGFRLAAMRQADAGHWVVHGAGTNHVLVHKADPAAGGYALAVTAHDAPRDLTASVRLRLVGGTRTGGLVWRYADEAHYYALVLDLGRQTLAMYRVAGGNRVRIEYEDDLELDVDAWHTLKIAHAGGDIRASIGGIRVFSVDDRRRAGTDGQGEVGLLSAGDAEVWYDDLHVETRATHR